MIKVPLSERRRISTESTKYINLLRKLKRKGKKSSEDDLRIILNDILSDVLGYDKYSDLATEQRERCGRLDYAVKLSEGPNAKKKDKLDFVIEAKALHVELSQKHIDQTLAYCLTTGTSYFILTNGNNWKLFQVKKGKRGAKPEAKMIHDLSFLGSPSQVVVEDLYIFSKHAYLAGHWGTVATQKMAANRDDIFTVLRMPKVVKVIQREIESYHGVKIENDLILDIIDNSISKDDLEINKTMERKLSFKKAKAVTKTKKKEARFKVVNNENLPLKAPLLGSEIKKAA